jgi:hypothetical protein
MNTLRPLRSAYYLFWRKICASSITKKEKVLKKSSGVVGTNELL